MTTLPSTHVLGGSHAASPGDLPAGARIGRYVVERPLGRGGFGTVYLAREADGERPVAIKTVRATSESAVEALRREIRALARIRHPGIVRIHDEGLAGGVPWYAMELVTGAPLDRQLSKGTPTAVLRADVEGAVSGAPLHGLELATVLALFRRLATALAYLHGEGLVHRDMKPSNVMIREPGGSAPGEASPVIMDLGLAAGVASAGAGEQFDVAGEISGTAAYMAPEQGRGDVVDGRADLYALGCMLFEALTGALPFQGTVREVLAMHQHAPPPAPSELRAGVPPQIDRLVASLLAKDPADRIPYAEDVDAALEALGGAPPPAEWPAPRLALNRPSLVGRHAVRRSLDARLEAAIDGRGGVAVLTGVSGSGKTRLAMQVATEARNRGALVMAATGERHAAPLESIGRLLQPIADRCRERGADETARLFGGDPSLLARYVPTFRDLPGAAPAAVLELPPSRDVPRLIAARLESLLLTLAGETPLLMVIDDCQWADPMSLEMVALLAESSAIARAKVLLLALSRSEEGATVLARLAA